MASRPSNPLALAVLVLLYERPMHPYQMSATLKERRKEDSIKINYGSLYSVVESLTKHGLIEARESAREGNRPERTIYAITGDGEREMISWLSTLLSDPVKEYPQFEAALSLMMALRPEQATELLERRLVNQRAALDTCRDQVNRAYAIGMPRVFGVEHEFEVALLAAEVDFLARLLDDIRDGSFSGLAGWQRMHELRAEGMTRDEIEQTLFTEFKEDFAWLDRLDELT